MTECKLILKYLILTPKYLVSNDKVMTNLQKYLGKVRKFPGAWKFLENIWKILIFRKFSRIYRISSLIQWCTQISLEVLSFLDICF